MGAGWKGHIMNQEYEQALRILNKDFIEGNALDEIEDIHLFHAGLLELYLNNNHEQAQSLLSAVSEDKAYMEQSKLHMLISLAKQEKKSEAKTYYLSNKNTLDTFKASNAFNISKVIDQLLAN